jgi:hypothetical protein
MQRIALPLMHLRHAWTGAPSPLLQIVLEWIEMREAAAWMQSAPGLLQANGTVSNPGREPGHPCSYG